MHLHELDFDFPRELIAQEPLEPRDSCRLMHLLPGGGSAHRIFSDLPSLLRAGDTLVFNDSRVLPARVEATKPTGGRVEVLFLRPAGPLSATDDEATTPNEGISLEARGEVWEVLARPSHRLQAGIRLSLPGGEQLTLLGLIGEGRWLAEGPAGRSLIDIMEDCGRMPLPPYIRVYPADPGSYQTVYAAEPGSAAAPTAGLHFTPELLAALENAGIGSAYVTLHVGLDTFLPIREEVVEDHSIHRETYTVTQQSLCTLRQTRRCGGRLVAVGTTAARVLETLAIEGPLNGEEPIAGIGERAATIGAEPSATGDDLSGVTQVFITPGYRFRAVDALLTNFHLPHSTVLALVMAFAGANRIRKAYREAIDMRYRLFSLGDAMLIEPTGTAADAGEASA